MNLEKWNQLKKPAGHHYRQGYLLADADKTIRVRLTDTNGFLTIKGSPVVFPGWSLNMRYLQMKQKNYWITFPV